MKKENEIFVNSINEHCVRQYNSNGESIFYNMTVASFLLFNSEQRMCSFYDTMLSK